MYSVQGCSIILWFINTYITVLSTILSLNFFFSQAALFLKQKQRPQTRFLVHYCSMALSDRGHEISFPSYTQIQLSFYDIHKIPVYIKPFDKLISSYTTL